MTNDSLSLKFLQEHPRESAKILEQFDAQELTDYFERIPATDTVKIIRYFTPSFAVACLSKMNAKKASNLLEKLGVEPAARIMRRMNLSLRGELLRKMSPLFANMLKLVLKFPKGTIGQYISPNVLTIMQDMETGQVFNSIRKTPEQLQNDIYIINDKQQLIGVVDVKSLLTVESDTTMGSIMRKPDVVFHARVSLNQVRDHPKWLHKEVLPVVDHANVFIGVLRRAVMLEALEGGQESYDDKDTIASALLDIAELFWDTCANLLIPETEKKKPRQ